MNQKYRYGLYLNPQANDARLTDLTESERLARKMSIENHGTPVAVWDADDRTVKLFAGYEEFVPSR